MAKTNAERQAEYRARQKEKKEQARGAEALLTPERLDTKINRSTKDKLLLCSEKTGQDISLIVERAVVEYLSRHLADMPEGEHYVYLRDSGEAIPSCVKLGDRESFNLPPCGK